MKLESPAFANGGVLPEKYGCNGEGISPPLEISGAPNGTKAFALVLDDPDSPSHKFVHWVAWNIPKNSTSIPEGASPGTSGKNSFGRGGYGAPCPPPGPAHSYRFTVYALDATLDLSSGATKEQLDAAMHGRILAQAELRGKYGGG
ncbi:MAG: YbhB/YbcL family Raf kinase inhibitor-like protein [Candidatus ainarchaeum sp.]|nr:YbhB/YbcL family Raf kinase inhibitor-like protein [Candidatus ainarchaeum sp.]